MIVYTVTESIMAYAEDRGNFAKMEIAYSTLEVLKSTVFCVISTLPTFIYFLIVYPTITTLNSIKSITYFLIFLPLWNIISFIFNLTVLFPINFTLWLFFNIDIYYLSPRSLPYRAIANVLLVAYQFFSLAAIIGLSLGIVAGINIFFFNWLLSFNKTSFSVTFSLPGSNLVRNCWNYLIDLANVITGTQTTHKDTAKLEQRLVKPLPVLVKKESLGHHKPQHQPETQTLKQKSPKKPIIVKIPQQKNTVDVIRTGSSAHHHSEDKQELKHRGRTSDSSSAKGDSSTDDENTVRTEQTEQAENTTKSDNLFSDHTVDTMASTVDTSVNNDNKK